LLTATSIDTFPIDTSLDLIVNVTSFDTTLTDKPLHAFLSVAFLSNTHLKEHLLQTLEAIVTAFPLDAIQKHQ
jgi:hypothetical protein